MNTTQLEFQAKAGGRTQNQRLREIFEARPGQEIPMTELGQAIGAWAVHSRIADLRKAGLAITNRVALDPATGQRHSFYTYLP